MKKISLFFFCFIILIVELRAQDTLYHRLYSNKEEPLVSIWNVPKDNAIKSKNYVMELTDSLGRVKALYFYYNGFNRRMRIDDPEIILFQFNDTVVDIYTDYSYETDYELWEDEDFRREHCIVKFDDNRNIISFYTYSFVDTFRRVEYLKKSKKEDDKIDNECVLLLEEYHGLETCKDFEVPYLSFSYYKFKEKRK